MKKPHELRAEAAAKKAEADKLFADILAAGRDATEAEEARYDDLYKEAGESVRRAKEIEVREQRANDLDAQLNQQQRPPADLPHNDPGNTRGGRHGYSLLKALRQSDPSNKQERLDGVELETHQELAKRRRGGHEIRGILVPWDLRVDSDAARRFARAQGVERRDLTTTTGGGAVFEVVDTTMIEFLRNLMLSRSLGVRVMADMNGNFSIPKQTGTGTAYWVTEGNAPTESNQTIGSVDFSPNTVGAFTDYSRKFLMQTSVDAEMFVREDLATVIAIEMDRVTFNGSGTGAEPEGVVPKIVGGQVVSLGTNGGPLTWAALVAMETKAAVANALMGSLAYVTTPAARGSMKAITRVVSSTFGDFLWPDSNQPNGYPAYATNQIPSTLTKGSGTGLSAIIFGDWTQAIWAMWGGLDILVDPYTGGTAGNVRIVELQDADFDVRRIESFSAAKDVVTT
jgi:HK97 family phage major capsid protein